MQPPFKNPLDFLDGIQWPVPFSKQDWEKTPEAVRVYIPWLHQRINAQDETIHRLSQRIDEHRFSRSFNRHKMTRIFLDASLEFQLEVDAAQPR